MLWTLDQLADLVEQHKYRTGTEIEFQNGLAQVLDRNGIRYHREYDLGTDYGRIDFFLAEQGTGIELKVKGSPSSVLRQLHRYARCLEIESLLLVTARNRLALVAREIHGKPLQTASVWLGQI